MTPLGHAALGGWASLLSSRLILPWVIAGSLLPDIDFVAFAHPDFNEIHRGPSHSLVVAIGVSAVLAFGLSSMPVLAMTSCTLGFALHILCDSMLDTNASNGLGVPLLWPFSPERIQLVPLADWLNLEPGSWREPGTMLTGAAQLLLVELFLMVSYLAFAYRAQRKRSTKP